MEYEDTQSWLCLNTSQAILEGQFWFKKNYRSVNIRLEHCITYKDPKDCASAEEAAQFWTDDSIYDFEHGTYMLMSYNTLDMQNITEPLQTIDHVFQLQEKMNQFWIEHTFLAQNEFTDDTDLIGFFSMDYEPKTFLSMEAFKTDREGIKADGIYEFDKVSY